MPRKADEIEPNSQPTTLTPEQRASIEAENAVLLAKPKRWYADRANTGIPTDEFVHQWNGVCLTGPIHSAPARQMSDADFQTISDEMTRAFHKNVAKSKADREARRAKKKASELWMDLEICLFDVPS